MDSSRPWFGGQALVALGAAALPARADAAFLSGEALETAADWVSWAVLVLVPIIVIVVFWVVHVMPEKIAHRRHHPQRDAIQTLCLLSLVFGGLLWPFAWLWAYTKPVAYRVAYGTDKHEDFVFEELARAREGKLTPEEHARVEAELRSMERRGALSPELVRAREELALLAAAAPAVEPASVAPATSGATAGDIAAAAQARAANR
jgi:CBS domain containing-hemolysin-like protein